MKNKQHDVTKEIKEFITLISRNFVYEKSMSIYINTYSRIQKKTKQTNLYAIQITWTRKKLFSLHWECSWSFM